MVPKRVAEKVDFSALGVAEVCLVEFTEPLRVKGAVGSVFPRAVTAVALLDGSAAPP